ncbi:Tn7 transposase TnsA N-terminal domain-containing protein [Photobacterium profundum]|uniref:TnsA endonuclease N-terminal domain-containing protein n=1 Tax=Photobacterium profundum TaxID=74109 RepID=UPI003D0E60B6
MYNRNLRKPNPDKNIYKFISVKNKTSIMCESSLEYDTCFLFEYNVDIVNYQSQPSGFEYIFEEKKRFYTPDFLAEYVDLTKEYFEVKPYFRAVETEFVQKFKAIKVSVNKKKTAISLISERQIHIQPRLDNAKLLYRYAGIQQLNPLQHEIVSFLRRQRLNQVSVKVLAIKLNYSQGDVNSNVLALLSAGYIQADIVNNKFNEEILLWVD